MLPSCQIYCRLGSLGRQQQAFSSTKHGVGSQGNGIRGRKIGYLNGIPLLTAEVADIQPVEPGAGYPEVVIGAAILPEVFHLRLHLGQQQAFAIAKGGVSPQAERLGRSQAINPYRVSLDPALVAGNHPVEAGASEP
jgi:hypothetical protein